MSSEELLEKRDLTDILCQTISNKEGNPKTFSKSISCYIDSTNKALVAAPLIGP
jgi:hypothetical protein